MTDIRHQKGTKRYFTLFSMVQFIKDYKHIKEGTYGTIISKSNKRYIVEILPEHKEHSNMLQRFLKTKRQIEIPEDQINDIVIGVNKPKFDEARYDEEKK